MAERISLGEKSVFLTVDSAMLMDSEGTATITIEGDSLRTVLRFPEQIAGLVEPRTVCATVTGEATLEVSINDDCFACGIEYIDVIDIEFFRDMPVEGRIPEVIPF
jgi:hypothetical protein